LLNFQSAQNATKTVPLGSSRFPDSDGIFTFTNRVCMEKISRSVHQAKQEKIWDADCTYPYSSYGHMEGRTIMMTWQREDVVHFYWLVVVQSDVDTCYIGSEWYEDTWPNTWAPRVPH
jgi:hypothetical protein